ncbi:hypothetical protein GCM10023189_29780 [Nibrella saemangeumensis]|uniref:Peptidase M43 pregnancy-associated plasma-A domain-containing protein n=1 Tax=Nibrella saemangeumensis TaxID=1084526 RepID=A0ABP8MZV3_9BACT
MPLNRLLKSLFLLSVLSLLSDCSRRSDIQPLADYYAYQRTNAVTVNLEQGRKTTVLLSVDTDSLRFRASATDAQGKDIPHALYTFLVDGKPLPSNAFLPAKEGKYQITAKLGAKESQPVVIEAVDLKSLVKEIRLQPEAGNPKMVLSDGNTLLRFSMVAIGFDDKPVPFDYLKGLTLYVNDQPLTSAEFTPRQEGTYRLVAKGFGRESSEIVISAHPKAYYIGTVLLKVNLNGPDFIADNLSAATFTVNVLDREGKLVDWYAERDMQLFLNGQLTQERTFRTRTPGVYRFKAVVAGKESAEYSLRALSFSEARIVTIPIVFHLYGVDIPQYKLQEQINVLNNTFRDNFNPSNALKADRHADLRLQFVLADTDPNGQPMAQPGRHYVDVGGKQYKDDEMFTKAGWDHYWNPEYYLNAYVANYIEEPDDNWAGKAYYPTVTQPLVGLGTYVKGSKPFYLFSMILKPLVFDGANNNTIITHEIGHMLGLYHAFNTNNCTSDADYCPDTPMYNRQNYNDKVYSMSRTDCNGQEFSSTNYMDYYYSFRNSFTLDQQTRVRHVLDYGLYLPTQFNGRSGRRSVAAPGVVKRPDVLWDVKPVACPIPHDHH